ncbi:NAD(P)H-hydrate dehydratase [Sulfitobacter pseudonitzschiae]|uniref:ADP-dependent (S)-NAD(P)H-hydrate dehydratase n=1 Tax=Pseudosulfitobacter pseudonitzschiae TaxID=1402135 RepID=A0A9Q2NSR7_9RHOB|nr:NAD(P)H-hydrate dehydratase [Pseudosulfitobacter pseudonitzschiae]MBM2298568.1 NAD(P)H-hydrate dehydratase [Pseudosulfitobacter pseudonitzschiae]MBM2303482.1 NAD(P)H-hydrate dehydratase [Pseudosulfitobacter pseudonitzschiae]MBM2313265.1 NAD(P)H-hydrate dehydratase [Pseudosulfitobacter pseudonitzschiae]MBM2318178.1 NAD(P)H-hydrate dehydratase [Pseudosulfitobacter pseudonitzschiae]
MTPHTITREDLPDLAKRTGHKFDHGHVLVLSGGPGRTGAARLAARAALRVGAGLVTLGVSPSAQLEVSMQITAVMLHRLKGAGDLAALLEDKRLNALCAGPGLGLDRRAADLVHTVLDSGRACVLDADALTLLSRDPALRTRLHDRCVLTPHGGEFARLFPDIAAACGDNPAVGPKVTATRDAAARIGAVVLFKGVDTVIASPDGECAVHSAREERSAPWLATAGAGDVLAGIISGLLARGFGPAEAAKAATWLHVSCAINFGPGLIAEDLPDALPAVLRDLAP